MYFYYLNMSQCFDIDRLLCNALTFFKKIFCHELWQRSHQISGCETLQESPATMVPITPQSTNGWMHPQAMHYLHYLANTPRTVIIHLQNSKKIERRCWPQEARDGGGQWRDDRHNRRSRSRSPGAPHTPNSTRLPRTSLPYMCWLSAACDWLPRADCCGENSINI